MGKKKERAEPFADLTWDDLEEWVGGKIVSRGERYQKQGRVSELAVTDDGDLVAWVSGTRRYATKVIMDEDGVPSSVCTCPYGAGCKHGVAVVLEYLEQMGENRRIPTASEDDDRLVLLEGAGEDEAFEEEEAGLPEPARMEIEPFFQGKNKTELVKLLLALAQEHPDIAQDLMDRQQLTSGRTKQLVMHLRREIRDIAGQPAWEDDWYGRGGYRADYSEIRRKLEVLLDAGYADEVLSLGRELIVAGTRAVEDSGDEGETAEEVAACMPVVAKALDRSSLTPAARLAWAVEAVLKDQYDLSSAFEDYLDQRHPKEAWNTLADQLLAQLKTSERAAGADEFSRNYARNQLSDWAIHALGKAGRSDEIIPLCEAEAPKTKSYDRLVEWLIHKRRYEDAERWIRKGIQATGQKWLGIGDSLREQFKTILTHRKDLPALAAMEVEEFVHAPSPTALADCEKAARKIGVWPQTREHLLAYLEKGILPWEQKGWPLPPSGLEPLKPSDRPSFPLAEVLIDIAIEEKDPERVLYWYDRWPKRRSGWLWVDEDRVATAIQDYAPDRAIAIWKHQAERLIDLTKPSAYDEAARYLRKAGAVMARQGRQDEWSQYLQHLKIVHTRKRRLIEVLDRLSRRRIMTKK